MSRLSQLVTYCVAAVLLLGLGSCKNYENFTTYFNTYYNMGRIMGEAEDEFAFTDAVRKVKPRTIVPVDSGSRFGEITQRNELAPFMREFIVDQQKLQPMAVKLDSVIIKGSKILKNHSSSNFVEGSLFHMGKSYFYRSEWLPAEVKCGELIDTYPTGDFSPDAHLLLSKTLLVQRKYSMGKVMLSRTVDIAWQKSRWDILAEAYRLMAEQELFEGDVDRALRPYRQAIIQSDDPALRAKWRMEVASLFYRLSRFDEAEKEFQAVLDERNDLLGEFEALLLRASSLIHLRRFPEAEKILTSLEENLNYKEWDGYILAEKLRLLRIQNDTVNRQKLVELEKQADKHVGNLSINTHYFEMGYDAYRQNDFVKARQYFSKCRTARSPVVDAADKYFTLLNELEKNQSHTRQHDLSKFPDSLITDTLRDQNAKAFYAIGRVFEQLGKPDSALIYFQQSASSAPGTSAEKARAMFAVYRLVKDSLPDSAEVILEQIFNDFPKTKFGQEARILLGFTEAAVIDSLNDLYQSATQFRMTGDFGNAIRKYALIFEYYPSSNRAPQALYTIGWIYERKLFDNDSALAYYKILVERYPQSQWALDVRHSLEAALSARVAKSRVPYGPPAPPGDTAIRGIAQPAVDSAPPEQTAVQVQSKTAPPPEMMQSPPPRDVRSRIPESMRDLIPNVDPSNMLPSLNITTPFGTTTPTIDKLPELNTNDPQPADSTKKKP